MSSAQGPAAPVVEYPDLPELDPGDVAELAAGERFDGVRFDGGTLADRDLSGVTLTECELLDVRLAEVQLRSARLAHTRVVGLDAPMLAVARSAWRSVHLERSRVGAAELYEGDLQAVTVSGSKLGWVNLRGAALRDVLVVDCAIDELDLSSATAERVAFRGCTVGTLTLGRARLRDVDLRGLEIGTVGGVDGMAGATISTEQAVALTDVFAGHLGVRVL